MDQEENVNKKWKTKRRNTFIVLMLLYFISAAENSSNISTLWIYITRLMNTNHPNLFYGLINASFYLPILLFSIPISRWADKTRRFKFCLVVAVYINMLGNILYIIPFSPFYALCGKFCQGFCLILYPLITAEIARSYPGNMLQHKLSLLEVSFTFGFSIAPLVATAFEKTDFWIGSIHITYGNVSGLVFLCLAIILQVAVVIFAHNLSKEFDLKQNTEGIIEVSELEPLISHGGKEWVYILKKLMTNFETLLLIVLSFYSVCMEIALFRMLPLIVLETLNYSYTVLNLTFFGFAFANIFLLVLIILCKINDKGVFYFGLFSLITLIMMAISLFAFSMKLHNIGIDITALVIFVVALSLFTLGESIFIKVVCAKLTRSSNQGYVETIRVIVKRIGSMLGAYTAVYLYYNSVYFSIFLLVTSLILILIILARKRVLMNPTPVI